MRHNTVRCTDCNTVVELPNVKVKSATCVSCLEKKRKIMDRSRPGRTHHVPVRYWSDVCVEASHYADSDDGPQNFLTWLRGREDDDG